MSSASASMAAPTVRAAAIRCASRPGPCRLLEETAANTATSTASPSDVIQVDARWTSRRWELGVASAHSPRGDQGKSRHSGRMVRRQAGPNRRSSRIARNAFRTASYSSRSSSGSAARIRRSRRDSSSSSSPTSKRRSPATPDRGPRRQARRQLTERHALILPAPRTAGAVGGPAAFTDELLERLRGKRNRVCRLAR